MKCKGPCGGEKGPGKRGMGNTRMWDRRGEAETVEGFALVECGSHIAPLRLGGSRFAVNAFVPANR